MIRPVRDIPYNTKTKATSQKAMIRSDIEEAISKGIDLFEFEGDYNWKYFAQYAREVASLITSKALQNAWREKYHTQKYAPCVYRNNPYILIHAIKKEDRMHVFGEIQRDGIADQIAWAERSLDEAVLDGTCMDWVEIKKQQERSA